MDDDDDDDDDDEEDKPLIKLLGETHNNQHINQNGGRTSRKVGLGVFLLANLGTKYERQKRGIIFPYSTS